MKIVKYIGVFIILIFTVLFTFSYFVNDYPARKRVSECIENITCNSIYFGYDDFIHPSKIPNNITKANNVYYVSVNLPISNPDILVKMPWLKALQITGQRFKKWDFLSKMTSLNWLKVEVNHDFDLSYLIPLENLEEVRIWREHPFDDLSIFLEMDNLRELRIPYSNNVPEKQLKELSEKGVWVKNLNNAKYWW